MMGTSRSSKAPLSLLPDHLAQHVIHGQAQMLQADPLTVSTPALQWSYALSFKPRPEILSVDDDLLTSSVRFEFHLSVASGRIGIGWTNPEDTAFVAEKYAAGDSCKVSFMLSAGTRIGRLVFRNVAAGNVPSVFTIIGARSEIMAGDQRRYPVAIPARDVAREDVPDDGATTIVFDTVAAREINVARIEWLEKSNLPLAGARVLDVGCGIGHFLPFYISRGCTVVGVDGRSDNIAELKRRHPRIEAHVADVQTLDPREHGVFDVIHCFGLLYHLESPVAALRRLSAMCRRLLILETMVCDSSEAVAVLVDETKSASQAMEGLGSRPSPSFIALALNRVGFDYVYGAAMPPRHPDFEFEWKNNLETTRNGVALRCILVASRVRLELPTLNPLVEQ